MTPLASTWLPVILRGSFDEISVLDAQDYAFVCVNSAAHDNLQYQDGALAGKSFFVVAPNWNREALNLFLKPLQTGHVQQLSSDTVLVRADGSSYPAELRFLLCDDGAPKLIVIAKDTTTRHQAAAAFGRIEARFDAIVTNTPGLVYQFRRMPNGAVSFPYLSEACHALLGISAEALRDNPDYFMELILADERADFLESMAVSAVDGKAWNWDGRIWIEAWRDIKWINLRASPRPLPDGSVQWEGIMTNVTQSKLGEAEIKRSRAQLAELSAHDERVKEEERTRIAREIHDDLGGNLTAIKMALALLRRRLPDDPDPALLEKTDYVDLLVDRTIEAIHRISIDLRPSILDFGIVAAIRWQAREFEKQLGIPCEIVINRTEIALPPDQASALFRIFQESLTNISKHAQASRVTVKLVRNSRGIRLEISDNGKGIAQYEREKAKSFGIRGMVERASALGGTLVVSAASGGGCAVVLRIPLPGSVASSRAANAAHD